MFIIKSQFNHYFLREITYDDLVWLYEIRQDPEVIENTISNCPTWEQHYTYITNIINDPYNKIYIFGNNICHRIGVVRLKHIDLNAQTMEIGGDIHKLWRGNGLGKIMYQLIFDIAKRMGIVYLYLYVFAHNTRAIALYESIGFTHKTDKDFQIQKNNNTIDVLFYEKHI